MSKKSVGSVLPQTGQAVGLATAREIMSDNEVAELLGVEHRTLRLWRKKRGLPHCKTSAKILRYKRSDIERWLDGFRVATVG